MSQGKVKSLVAEKAIGLKALGPEFQLTEKDALLYAVGIGFNLDPLKEQDFKYTNELSQHFSVFPTMASIMRSAPGFHLMFSSPNIPSFPLYNLLHGEEKLYMVKPDIKIGVKYQQEHEILDTQDKGKNGLIITRTTCYQINEKGGKEKIFYVDRSYFVRGIGGFGFKGNNKSNPIGSIPKKPHDTQFTVKTYPNQCFVYRLCQDINPLHIDPNMASMAGFEKPIIHGLATYGTVARGLSQHLLGNNHTAIQSIQVKLVGHLFPGETLKVKVWTEGNKRYFQAEVVERQKKVVTGVLTVREGAKL